MNEGVARRKYGKWVGRHASPVDSGWSYTGLGLVRAILVGFGGLGDVQGGEVHMRARIQGAGRGHYQAQAPAKLLFAPVSVRQCCRMCAVVIRTV